MPLDAHEVISEVDKCYGLKSWFQISADTEIYHQYRIVFSGTQYDIDLIISADISDTTDTSDVDSRY